MSKKSDPIDSFLKQEIRDPPYSTPKLRTHGVSWNYPCCGTETWRYVQLEFYTTCVCAATTIHVQCRNCKIGYNMTITSSPNAKGTKPKFHLEFEFAKAKFSIVSRPIKQKRRCAVRCAKYTFCKGCYRCSCLIRLGPRDQLPETPRPCIREEQQKLR